jgi:hypothetical protein
MKETNRTEMSFPPISAGFLLRLSFYTEDGGGMFL